jgi:hypothetical protein
MGARMLPALKRRLEIHGRMIVIEEPQVDEAAIDIGAPTRFQANDLGAVGQGMAIVAGGRIGRGARLIGSPVLPIRLQCDDPAVGVDCPLEIRVGEQ